MSEFRGPRSEVRGPENRIDAAIDHAVREILDVEPPAGLRGRVIARIDNPTAVASGFSRKIFWVGAPLVGAAIVVLAVLLPREQVQPQAPAPITVATVQPDPTPEAESRKPEAGSREPEAGSGKPEAGSRKREAGNRDDRVITAAAFAPAPADIASGIQPLKAIDPIQITPLMQDSIAPAPIEFRPLSTITEVQIAPLSPPERRH